MGYEILIRVHNVSDALTFVNPPNHPGRIGVICYLYSKATKE